MKLIVLEGVTVALYDSVKSLPIHLSKKFNEHILKDAGIGNSIEDVDDHLGRIFLYANSDKKAELIEEIKNLRFNMFSMLYGLDYKSLAFGCLIAKVNDKPVEDYESEGLAKLIDELSAKGLTNDLVESTIAEVKKNWAPNDDFTSPSSSETT